MSSSAVKTSVKTGVLQNAQATDRSQVHQIMGNVRVQSTVRATAGGLCGVRFHDRKLQIQLENRFGGILLRDRFLPFSVQYGILLSGHVQDLRSVDTLEYLPAGLDR